MPSIAMYVVGQGHPMCEIFGEINVIPETWGRASPMGGVY